MYFFAALFVYLFIGGGTFSFILNLSLSSACLLEGMIKINKPPVKNGWHITVIRGSKNRFARPIPNEKKNKASPTRLCLRMSRILMVAPQTRHAQQRRDLAGLGGAFLSPFPQSFLSLAAAKAHADHGAFLLLLLFISQHIHTHNFTNICAYLPPAMMVWDCFTVLLWLFVLFV